MSERFWENKTLEQMSLQEWESLCDGCGQCCLVRIEDENSGEVYDTNVICRHYDCSAGGCKSYSTRTTLSDGCVQLTPELLAQFDWLPESCAYQRHRKGLPLLAGHPLLIDEGRDKSALLPGAPLQAECEERVISVVDKYRPVGLIENGPEIIPEQHLVFPDELSPD